MKRYEWCEKRASAQLGEKHAASTPQPRLPNHNITGLTLVHVQNGQHLKSALNLSSAFKTQHKLWLEMLKNINKKIGIY